MAPASLPPASSVLAALSLPSNRLAAARLAPERGGSPVAAKPGIDHYRILRTDEVDATDAPLTAEERASIMATAAAAIRSTGDDFAGTARMAAKLSIADAPAENFETVAAVIATLPAKSDMVNHDPRIRDDRESERVVEEERNARLSAFLYAASRENDNDFHLIVGQNPQGQEEVYMTMEASGLPQASAESAWPPSPCPSTRVASFWPATPTERRCGPWSEGWPRRGRRSRRPSVGRSPRRRAWR